MQTKPSPTTKKFKINYSVLGIGVLLFILVLLIIANYSKGTFLSGWDNLQTELAPDINLKRTLDAAWSQFQGLGAFTGLAYAADLPRQLLVLLLSLFLPTNVIRYVEQWIFLGVGMLGMYFLAKKILLDKLSPLQQEVGATIGGLFYLLNLATMQAFYFPLELFTVHFAILPWLIMFGVKYLRDHRSKDLFIFAILNIAGASQAFNPTVFLVYCLMIGIAILVYLPRKQFLRQLGISILLVLTIIFVNLFWLLPFGRFLMTGSQQVSQSRVNQLASDVAFLQNQEYGDIENIMMLKGFWFGSTNITQGGQNTNIMPEWNEHVDLLVVKALGIGLFLGAVVGIVLLFFKRDKRLAIGIVLGALVCFVFLGAGNAPFGFIFDFIRDHVPLAKEALRFPFTKFSILLALLYSMGLSVTAATFASLIDGFKASRPLKYLIAVTPFLFLIVLFSFPSFQGVFISPEMRINVPDSYFEMFQYFRTQPKDTRILHLPVQTHWGWSYNNWGYQGSGFIWYGIEQPVLDRTFDVWSPFNEQVYREFRTAYYGNDVAEIERILAKYDITWLLWDNSKFIPGGYQQEEVLNFPGLQNLLFTSKQVTLEKVFGKELFLYKFTKANEKDTFITSTKDIHNAGSLDRWYDTDGLIGINYYNVANNQNADIIAPFKETVPINHEFKYKIDEQAKQLKYIITGKNDYLYLGKSLQNSFKYEAQFTKDALQVLVYAQAIESDQSNPLTKRLILTIPVERPTKDFDLVIDDQIYGPFNISLANGGAFYVGQGQNFRSRDISVRVYEEMKNSLVSPNILQLGFKNCDANLPNGTVDQSILASVGLRVFVHGTYGCAVQPIFNSKLANHSTLAHIELTYVAEKDSLAVCVVTDEKCIEQPKLLRKSLQRQIGTYDVELGIAQPNTGLQINVDDTNKLVKEGTEFVDLEKLEMKFYELIQTTKTAHITLTANDQGLTQNQLLSADAVTTDFTSIYSNGLNHKNDVDEDLGCVNSSDMREESSEGRSYLRFQVGTETNCLNANLQQLDTSESYLFAFDVYKNSGKTPSICLLDVKSNTCSIVEALDVQEGEWKRNFYILPGQQSNTGQGYKLILYNYQIGHDNVDYAYDNIEVYKFNNKYFYKTVISTDLSVLQDGPAQSDIKPTSENYNGYTVNLSQMPIDYKYLILEQGYEPGWLLVNKDTTLQDYINALLGKVDFDNPNQPKIYRGWGNVWDVSKLDPSQTVQIVFVPQYLIVIGWGITILTLLLLGSFTTVRSIRRGTRKNKKQPRTRLELREG